MQVFTQPELLRPLGRASHQGSAEPLQRMHPHHPSPDIASGFLEVDPEIVLKTKGFNFNENLYYSSAVASVTEFGLSRSASTRAYLDTASGVVITRGDFSQANFLAAGTSGAITTFVRALNEANATTVVYDSGTQEYSEWVSPDLKLVYKNQTGSGTKNELCRVENSQGIAQTYTYGSGVESGLLKSVEVTGGKKVTLTYAAGSTTSLVSSIEDWGNRRWTFQYDASSRLTTFTTPVGCITKYAYSLAGGPGDLLHVIEDPRGYRTTYMYDASRRVVSMAAGSGVWTYTYAGTDRTVVSPSGAVTTHILDGTIGNVINTIHPEGYTSTFTYNTNRLQIAEQRPSGYVMSMSYWGDGADSPYTAKAMLSMPKWTADAFGNKTSFTYDNDANLTKIEYPDGGVVTQVWSGHLMTVRVDQLGRTTSYTYNGDGLLRTVQDPRGLVTTMNYDAEGNVASVVYSNGGIVTNTYDSLNRLSTSTDPLGRTTTYAYDAGDNLTSVTNPAGETTTYIYDGCLRQAVVNPLGFRTTYTYNRFAKPATVKNALGFVTTMNYDVEGRQIETVNALGFITTQVYSAAGQRTAVIDALGNRTSFTYDSSGRPETVKNALGFVSTSVYDARDQIATVDALGNRSTYSYDNMRRQTAVQNARGFLSTTVYDLAGQVSASIDALGNRTTMTYNAVGSRETVKNPRGFTNTFIYESNSNRQLAVQDALGSLATNTYDIAGQTLAVQNALGNLTSYTYDLAGRMKTVQDALGNVTTQSYDAAGQNTATTDALGRISTSVYDAVGQTVNRVMPNGATNTMVYDAVGQATEVTDALAHTSTSIYDAVGRTSAVVNPLGFRTTFSYDAVGQNTEVLDARGNRTTSVYDALGRVQAAVDQLAKRTTYSYDAVSNQTEILDAKGGRITMTYTARNEMESIKDQGGRATTYTYLSTGAKETRKLPSTDLTTYTYDALDRLVTTVYADATRVTLAYDAIGRTTTMADSTGTATYVYDAVNRLTDKTDPGALRQQYSYDAVGNGTRLVEPNGNVRTYTYDNMDRVSVFTDPEAKKTTFMYDALGRNTTVLFTSGLRFMNSFDAASQQTLAAADFGVDHFMSQFAYSYDGVGNRTVCLDTVFDSTQTMTYDAKNRLTRWQGLVIANKDYAYTYDEIDNRLTDTETGTVRTWTYDASSRLTTMAATGGAITSFTFDANGNMTNVNESGTLSTLSYDKENRMVSYADGSGTTASAYNGSSQKVKQGSTTLVWDGWDYLGEVNGGSFDCETFTVNSQILAEKRTGNERLDFERTALGSVCTKYDQTNIGRAGVQRYKPYGDLEFHDSTLPTWQWVGSWGYRPTGLSWSDYYVRARHYGTQQAQWTTVDPLWPQEEGYSYCDGSPASLTDESGLSTCANCCCEPTGFILWNIKLLAGVTSILAPNDKSIRYGNIFSLIFATSSKPSNSPTSDCTLRWAECSTRRLLRTLPPGEIRIGTWGEQDPRVATGFEDWNNRRFSCASPNTKGTVRDEPSMKLTNIQLVFQNTNQPEVRKLWIRFVLAGGGNECQTKFTIDVYQSIEYDSKNKTVKVHFQQGFPGGNECANPPI